MTVYKRKDRDGGDVWWIDYYYQGTRYRQKIGAKRKAEGAMAEIRSKIAAGDFVAPDKRTAPAEKVQFTFAKFAEEEFLPWSGMQHSEKHHIRLRSILGKHLMPLFGTVPLGQITTKQIEDYKLSRRRHRRGSKAVAEATVNRELCCLKVVLRKAVEWGHIETSTARDVKTYKESPEAPQLLEAQEVESLLREMPDHLRGLIACAVYAGLRREELFHLRWEDINWTTGELTVASRRDHHTKNYQSRRIPMNTALTELLRRHPRQLGSLLVFCSRDGKPYTDVRDSLNAAALRAGIKGGARLHQLRHAFCSHALMQGIDPRTVQRWMGHKDITTTMRYAHVSPDHERAAIQRLSYTTGHQVDTKVEIS